MNNIPEEVLTFTDSLTELFPEINISLHNRKILIGSFMKPCINIGCYFKGVYIQVYFHLKTETFYSPEDVKTANHFKNPNIMAIFISNIINQKLHKTQFLILRNMEMVKKLI